MNTKIFATSFAIQFEKAIIASGHNGFSVTATVK